MIPDGVSIMEQFKIAVGHMLKVLADNPKMTTGVVNMIRPDGTQPAPEGLHRRQGDQRAVGREHRRQ